VAARAAARRPRRDLRGAAALQGLGLQAGWTLVLVVLGRLAMDRTMRRLEMQGG
jgi:ABC-2 type transport system permease protein